MGWRVAAVATIAAVIGVIAGSVEQTVSAPAPRCEQAPGRTLAATERIRILTRHDDAFACVRGSRRMLRIGDYPTDGCYSSTGCPFVHGFRFAGRYIAYAESFFSGHHDFATATVHLADMKRYEQRMLWDPKPSPPREAVTVGDVEVTKRGSVAFIMERKITPAAVPDRRVYRIQGPPAGDEAELLDAAAEIETDSLAESGRHLYWTNGGAARSAAIE
jgi:hypothetical protein